MNTQINFLELLDLIKTIQLKYAKELGESYSRKEIESAIKIHPIPESLVTIYSCVDSNYTNCSSLIPYYDLIPLSHINTLIDIFHEISPELVSRIGEKACHEIKDWRTDMIPFLEDGGGSLICVRTLPNDKSVWAFPKACEPRKLNTNLDCFILTAIECYRQGAFYKDVLIWNVDDTLAQEIVKVIDPEIETYFAP
jgi:hypothetical protein